MRQLPVTPSLLGLIFLAVTLTCGPAGAADDAKGGRDKEALRRVQQALRQSQAKLQAVQDERALLQTQHSALEAKAAEAEKELTSTQGQVRSLRAELARSQAEGKRLSGELASLKTSSQAEQTALQGRLDDLGRRLTEHQQTLANVTNLLGHSTQALSTAEEKNRQLYAIGRDVIARYHNKGIGEVLAQQEPVFGLREVTLENEAEALRTQIEAQRLVVPTGATASAPTGAGPR